MVKVNAVFFFTEKIYIGTKRQVQDRKQNEESREDPALHERKASGQPPRIRDVKGKLKGAFTLSKNEHDLRPLPLFCMNSTFNFLKTHLEVTSLRTL